MSRFTPILKGAALVAFALGLPVAASAQSARPTQGPAVTYTKNVAPIFRAKCEVCHRAEGMAPISFTKFEEVRPWVRSIRLKVVNREMPPWFINQKVGISKFANDRSLSDAEIETITAWVDAGAPAGDPKDMPPAVKWPSGDEWQLAGYFKRPPDLVLKSSTYMMPAAGQDQWWESMSDYVFPEDRWVAGTETKPAARSRKVVHHAGTHLYQREDPTIVKAKAALLGGAMGDASALMPANQRLDSDGVDWQEPGKAGDFFSEWAVGKNGELYAETESGQFIRKGARMGWDVHLCASGEATPAELEVALWFYPKDVVPRYRAFKTMFWGISAPRETPEPPLEISPGELAVHEGYTRLGAPAMILNFQPHMHLRGKAMTMEVIYPDGRVEALNSVEKFNFRWMVNYIYDKDVAPVLPRGAIIKVTAWHDNTAANKDNPDPRQFVTFGQRSVDEMAHSNEVIVFITDADYDRIMAERKAKAEVATRTPQRQQ